MTVIWPSHTSSPRGVLPWLAFAHAGRSQKQEVPALAEEAAAGQVVDLLLLDRRVEGPVEVLQRLQLAEAGRLGAALQLAVGADGQLVLEDQLQELGMAEVIAGGFLQAEIERLQQARQPQLLEGLPQGIVHEDASFC